MNIPSIFFFQNDAGDHVSNRREEMTVIFVQLCDEDKFVDIIHSNSYSESSLEASLPTMNVDPVAPYVDMSGLSYQAQTEIELLLT